MEAAPGEAVTSPASTKPLLSQFPRCGRSPSAAETFAMHKRRIQEGFEPERAATRTTVLAMVVQVCFLVLLLAVIFGLRKADDEGTLPAILEPLRAEAGIPTPTSHQTIRRGDSQLYSRGGGRGQSRAWVLVGGSAAGPTGGASLQVLGIGGKARQGLELVSASEGEAGDVTAGMAGPLQLSTGGRGSGVLYATDSGEPGAVVALQVGGGSGQVSVLGNKVQAQGNRTLLTTSDATGRWLLALSPHSATLEVFPLQKAEGGGVQAAAVHVEKLGGRPSGVFVGTLHTAVYVVCKDTGRVLLYRLDPESGALSLATTMSLPMEVEARGSCLAFANDMRHAYMLTKGGHVAVFQVRPDASLVHSTHKGGVGMAGAVHLLEATAGEGGQEGPTVEPLGLAMSPSGRVLLASYASGGGGEDTRRRRGYVALLRVDGRSGAVTTVQQQGGRQRAGTQPQSLAFNQQGTRAVLVDAQAEPQAHNVLLFRVDEEGGKLVLEDSVRVAGTPASAVIVSPGEEEEEQT